jgi:Ala-tRNA(Pro) deacylase
VRTSEEAAEVRGATLASGAKAMLLATKPSDEFVLAIISASEKMDSKAFKKAGAFKSTKFATEEEVFRITGCRPGAVPPFGSLWGLRTFVDDSLLKQGDEINFNSGLKTHSVRMSTADYVEVEKPVVASFRSP